MGAHPEPTSLLKLRGSYNTTLHKKREDDKFPTLDTSSLIPAPECLSERAKNVWRSITNRLLIANILSDIDLPILEQALLLQDEIDAVQSEIIHIRNKKRKKQEDFSRWFKLNGQLVRTTQLYSSLMGKFGCTPSDRTKILSIATLVQTRKDGIEKEENPILAILNSDHEN